MTPEQHELASLRNRVLALCDIVEVNKALIQELASTGRLWPDKWGLNPQQAEGLAILWKGGIVEHRRLPHASVVVYQLRKRLPEIRIITHSGVGYEVSLETRTFLDGVIKNKMARLRIKNKFRI